MPRKVGQRVQNRLLLLGPPLCVGVEAGILDGDGCLGCEEVEEAQLFGTELPPFLQMDGGKRAHEALADEEGDHHHAPGGGVGVLVRAPFPGAVVGNDQRLLRACHLPHGALAHAETGPRGVGADVVAGHDLQLAAGLVEDGQLAPGDAQEGHGPLHHALEHPGKLQLS